MYKITRSEIELSWAHSFKKYFFFYVQLAIHVYININYMYMANWR